jgi:N-acetyl-beta-hexosaminidase
MHLMKLGLRYFILLVVWITATNAICFSQIKLLPSPSKITMATGVCKLSGALNPMQGSQMLAYDEWLNLPAVKRISLADWGIGVSASDFDPVSNVLLERLPSCASQAYRIKIMTNEIFVDNAMRYTSPLQTLYQLCQNYGDALPCCTIVDTPKFAYRGMHLDVSRHFFEVDEVKAYIDLLARYKYNVFHWHLTDDQGWRIEIKKYPELCTKGSTRPRTIIGRQMSQTGIENKYDEQEEKGFYSQEQVKEIVRYARKLNIIVIPEIEMPGHSKAAVAAYPWLGCTGGATAVGDRWGVFDEVYCAGKDSTFEFLADVLNEVCDLFPSAYIHIGGDEVVYTEWSKCPSCRARMTEEGLSKVEQLQSYFVRRVQSEVLDKRNRRMVGWDELVDDGLDTTAIIMSWRGTEGGLVAATRGHDVVMTPGSHCYFDHAHSRNENEPLSIGGNTPLQKVFAYNPIPTGLSADKEKHILGAQANLWTEYIADTAQLFYMVLPRMLALSEVLWYGRAKSYDAFYKKLVKEYVNLDAMSYNYRLQEPLGYSPDTLSLAAISKYTLASHDPATKIEVGCNTTDALAPYRNEDLMPLILRKKSPTLYFTMDRKGKKSVKYLQNFK